MSVIRTISLRVALTVGMLAVSSSAFALPFAVGDVFASIGGGLVNVYSQTGVLKQTLDTTLGGFTTGSTTDAAGNFYVTAFSANQISQFDSNGNLVDASWTAGIAAPESIVFDSAGNAYIGNAGAAQIQKVDAAGNPITTFATLQNTDWIDLNADQVTLLYSNEGSTIRQLNTATNVDTVFTTGSYGALYAKRYLLDGSVLAASSTGNVYHWNSAGVEVGSCNPGIGSVFAMNLDPDGTSFWTGTTGGQSVVKVDIASCAILQSWSTGSGQLFGLSVFGEIQAGGGGTGGGGGAEVPEPATIGMIGAGLAALYRRRRQQA